MSAATGFSVKLVGVESREFPFFGRAGKPALMNFPDSLQGRRVAASVPVGHRSLVYLMAPIKRFWTAIEYIKCDPDAHNLLEEGRRAAICQDAVAIMQVVYPHYAKLWRCVRILALIDDPTKAPTPEFNFNQGDVQREISEQEYHEMFDAVPWSWTA